MRTSRRTATIAALALAAGLATPTIASADTGAVAPDGKTWQVTDFPSKFGGLNAVSIDGKSTVAIGFGIAKGFRFTPIAAAWDGDAWQRQPVHIKAYGASIQLTDADLNSSKSGWAVGNGFDSFGSFAVTARWNGSKWREIPTAALGGELGLAGVTAIRRGNVWAVGQDQVGDVLKPVIGHYSDHEWSEVKAPKLQDVGASTALSSIAAVSKNRLWAVGQGGVALRYKNSKWKQVDVPKIGGEYVQLAKVRKLPNAGMWAVGYASFDDGRHPVALHWTGKSWDVVSVPVDAIAQLNDVTSTANGVVAVGYTQDGPTAFYGLKLNPNGPSQPLGLPDGESVLYGTATDQTGTELWAVGSGPGPGAMIVPYAALRK